MLTQYKLHVFDPLANQTRLTQTDLKVHIGIGCFRLRELHTLKGHVESVVKLKGLDIETIQQHYTV